MAWWFLGAAAVALVAAGAAAGVREARNADRCEHGTRNDLPCAGCDEPAWCPMCEGPCYGEADDADERRLP